LRIVEVFARGRPVIDLTRPFSAGTHPARAFLLQRGVYALLAFDVWLTMISHGARYGMGGFNVTHFALLDALLPVPSPTFYVGALTLVGLAALLHLLIGGARFLRVGIFVLYTACWMVSLFDSYQHHYLLSWILLWLACMPDVPLESAQKRDVLRVNSPFVPMLSITAGIVYSFTAVAKSEADFRGGFVLSRLSKTRPPGDLEPGALDPLRDLLMSLFEVDAARAFAWIAHSVIALQVAVAVAYFLAAERDERPSDLRSLVGALGLIGALSFHAFSEIGGMFEIGWFSYYMLWLALCLLTPASAVAWLARACTLPDRALAKLVQRGAEARSDKRLLAQLAVSAALLCLVGWYVDLPGTLWASLVLSLIALGWGLFQLRVGFVEAAHRLSLSLSVAAVLWGLVLTQSDVRFDYYRRAGGELLGLGQLEVALSMYRKANRYAGPGRSRKKQIRELEQMIQAGERDSH